MIPGEYILKKEDIIANADRITVKIVVINTGDRPVQIGSHFHFFEVNKQMEFDREKAFGMRLNIAAGTAVRFEPGEEKEIELVEFGGSKKFSASTTWWMDQLKKSIKRKRLKQWRPNSLKTKQYEFIDQPDKIRQYVWSYHR